MKNYGLKYDKPDPKHWVFGQSALPMEVLQEDGNWATYLPKKEVQNLNGIEPYACVIFTILNCAEILIKKQYGLDRNYSDRFLATIVDTQNGGCTPEVACEFLRKVGVVPEEVWPFDASVTTSETFFITIPPEIQKIAEDFKAEWDFNHEFVQPIPYEVTKALKCSPLLISVSAWFQGENGKFYRPDGMMDNHATTMFDEEEGSHRRIFDTYDTPIIKDVDWNAVPMIVKRFYIKKKNAVVVKPKFSFISLIKKIWTKIFQHLY